MPFRVFLSPFDFPVYKSEVKVAQLCPTPCDPMDYTVHGILQARILAWVDFPFSRGSIQGSNPDLPTLQVDALPAEPQKRSLKKNWYSIGAVSGISCPFSLHLVAVLHLYHIYAFQFSL